METSDSTITRKNANQLCYAVLTPTGRGAIATVAVCGSEAISLVSRRFTSRANRPLESFEIGRTVFGRFQIDADVAEELVLGLIAPDQVEIHCHGGTAAAAAICHALIADGCAQKIGRAHV